MVADKDPIRDDVEEAAAPRGGSLNVVDFEESATDAEDEGDDDSPKKRLNLSAALTAIRAVVGAALRPLALIGVAALILGWTAMLWQISGSLAALNDAASSIAAELGAGQAVAATVVEAEDSPAAASEVALTEPPSVEPTAPPPAMLLGKLIVTNGKDLWDCADFETWDQAKLVYEANMPQDPNILDFFVTGVPCADLQTTE